MKYWLVIWASMLSSTLLTQPLSNSWVNHNQSYLKFPIAEDGVYKINRNTLAAGLSNVGLDINSIDPRNIQIIGRGVELNILIEGESDGSFDPTDEIIFYAKRNDGWFDQILYEKPEHQMNPHYSLISDTAHYFLTLNSSVNNRRLRRMTNRNFTGKTPLDFVWTVTRNFIPSYYNEGQKDGAGVSNPQYIEGEGWCVRRLSLNSSFQLILQTPEAAKAAGIPNAVVKSNTAGASNAAQSPNHGLEIYYGPSGNRVKVVDLEYLGYEMHRHQFSIPATAMQNSTRIHYVQSLSPQPASDFQAIAFAEIKYARNLNLSGVGELSFSVPASIDSSYVRFTGASGTYSNAYDFERGYYYPLAQSGTSIEFLSVPGPESEFQLIKDNNIQSILDLKPITSFGSGTGKFTNFTNLEVDSALILITHGNYLSSATQYAGIKRSAGLNTVVVRIEELYDQFAHGISMHPLAVQQFSQYLLANWSSKPTGLFLIGQSVKENLTRRSSSNSRLNKVPTFGVPPADNLFSSDIADRSVISEIPVGRLAAENNNDVLIYLDKVREFQSEVNFIDKGIDNMLWRKVGLHLVGGADINEQRVFKQYLDKYKITWQDSALGGYIHDFERYQSGATQSVGFDSIGILINRGVSLLSFFGHGSGGELGINIGEPTDFSNRGKYPLFITNSCNVGDYHLPNSGTSTVNERWILTPQRGAIGFLASTSLGYPSILDVYSSEFYQNLARDTYQGSIGTAMRETQRALEGGGDFIDRVCLEMNLHGDPTLQLYPKELPDLAIEEKYTEYPNVISADQLTFPLKISVFNLGKGTLQNVPIEVKRTYPNGRDTTYRKIISGVNYTAEVIFDIPVALDAAIGENNFRLHVNPNQTISERFPSENNIIGSIKVNVTSDDLLPVYPYNFAVVPDKEVTLKASTADPFSPQREYIMQIDITDQFNSPMLRETRITASGGVVSWNPKLFHAPDSVVYYWRCSPVKNDPSQRKWRQRSFQIIPDQRGWSQFEFPQYANNDFSQLTYNRPTEEIEFSEGNIKVSATCKGQPAIADLNNIKWSINGAQQGRTSVCAGASSILISVIDPSTGESWETRWIDNSVSPPIEYNSQNSFGNWNDPANSSCPQRDRKFQFLVTRPQQMDSMISMINNHVPDSFYILVNHIYGSFQDTTRWKERHFQAFEALGADSIRKIPNDFPYLFFTQKGNPNKAVEVTGVVGNELISISQTISGKIGNGSMSSTSIGPVKSWDSFNWSGTKGNFGDSLSVSVFGENDNGELVKIFELDTKKDQPDLESNYPEIRNYRNITLRADYFDRTQQSAPIINKWQLLYDEVPELAISPNKGFSWHADTLKQGEELKLAIPFENVSPIDVENVWSRCVITSISQNREDITYRSIGGLKGLEIKVDSIAIPTFNRSGLYALLYDLNPEDTLWQPEKEHFNNIFTKVFYVVGDQVNPLLDVTFDGIHILDGDIVSARPDIRISLSDDNEFLPLEDTSSFDVFLTQPNGIERRLSFNTNETQQGMIFNPASGKSNKASIEYRPVLSTDGVYKLRVKATDVSGNQSGASDYAIRFEVINRSTITNVMNYPNPFTTSTRFVFTLTGWKIPDFFRIQILSVSGRVVREIDRNELGNIHIGRNITSYAWDGTDQFGDRLANGVYFYRVITKIEGEEIEHRESGADGYFTKGFGKMVLFR